MIIITLRSPKLMRLCDCQEIIDTGKGPVTVKVQGEEGAVAAIIDWLAARREVLWVEPQAKIKMLSLDVEAAREEQKQTTEDSLKGASLWSSVSDENSIAPRSSSHPSRRANVTACTESWASFDLPHLLGDTVSAAGSLTR